MRLKADEMFKCPHCGEEQEAVVEDYAIPGRTGEASRAKERCWECDKFFYVENNEDGTCTVTK